MPYVFAQPTLNKNIRVCWYDNAFSSEECDLVVSSFSKAELIKAGVSGENTYDDKIRKSKVSWHDWNQENDWLYQKLHHYAQDANNARWQFNLSAFSEPIQFTKYEGDGGHYDYHQDSGTGPMSIRKLSMVLLLSDPKDYDGGQLELFNHEPFPTNKGTLIIFPSYEQHKVHPVTRGVRYSLVAWVSGPPYK